jgi:hypothetical protein
MANTTIGNVPGNDCLGMIEDLLMKLRKGVITREQLGRFLKKENSFSLIYRVLVDRNRDLRQDMLKIEPNITDRQASHMEKLPVKGTGVEEVEISIIQIEKNLSSEQVIEELDKQGFRPADLSELLAVGVVCPDLGCKFIVNALGSHADFVDTYTGCVCHCLPSILWDGKERRVFFRHWSVIWKNEWFAVVRK